MIFFDQAGVYFLIDPQSFECPVLVFSHQRGISDDVGEHYGSESAFFGHGKKLMAKEIQLLSTHYNIKVKNLKQNILLLNE
jgi:hypothetical protein